MKKEKGLVPVEPSIVQYDETMSLGTHTVNKAKEWEDFIGLWMMSRDVDSKNQWFKGDIVNRLATIYGENSIGKFAQEVQESLRSIYQYRRAARAFDEEHRNMNISFTHYLLASYTDEYNKGNGEFTSDERFKWIEKANDNSWSTGKMAQEIKKKNALVKENKDIFEYYDSYLDKVNYVLTHMEKEELGSGQANALLDKLKVLYRNLADYLQDVR